VTGFLLESQLALTEAGIPPQIESRLRTMAAMADRLRTRLGGGTIVSYVPGKIPEIPN
jgi:hypothetical protein